MNGYCVCVKNSYDTGNDQVNCLLAHNMAFITEMMTMHTAVLNDLSSKVNHLYTEAGGNDDAYVENYPKPIGQNLMPTYSTVHTQISEAIRKGGVSPQEMHLGNLSSKSVGIGVLTIEGFGYVSHTIYNMDWMWCMVSCSV